ncbi:sodium channel protein Nach-like, partial [Teleopsis dalmanni]|uniref:sodium channel protein Nach-like n=1 Tax=Teleopsis dalmanni TaxID=139649 RepID=UPI0018CF1E55
MANKFIAYIREYCENCTIAGLGYIANRNLHFTERIFWLTCLILSSWGAYYLINDFKLEFENKPVSIVYESLSPMRHFHFPSLCVCEAQNIGAYGDDLEAYVNSLGTGFDGEYNDNVEKFLSIFLYPEDYYHSVMNTCEELEECEECSQCPESGYRDVMEKLAVNCSAYFVKCKIADRVFDCCQYFLQIFTPFGNCFLMNSLQNNHRGSKNWLHTAIDPVDDTAEMKIFTQRPMKVMIVNEEDIPHRAVQSVSVSLKEPGMKKDFYIYVENMVNDPEVRDVSIKYRKCRFPDETLPNTLYRVYSFSACLSDCLRFRQLYSCNCTLPHLLPGDNKNIPECTLKGVRCLHEKSLINPDIGSVLNWTSEDESTKCECLPSCTEDDFQAVYEKYYNTHNADGSISVTIKVPNLPTQRYRRQSLRTKLDVVVNIGGVLGLFMGVSILSALELLYYFTLRIFNN